MEESQQKTADALLALRCQLGEPDAWEQLVRQWHPRLWRFTSGMLSDQQVAEDVLQTIWLRVVRSLIRLKEPEKLAAWMYRVARFAIADQLRLQYRQPPQEVLPDIEQIDDSSEMFDMQDFLQTGLSQLHPNEREAVVLHYLELRPIQEVAEICDVRPGTIKSRLHRARKQIRNTLNEREVNE